MLALMLGTRSGGGCVCVYAHAFVCTLMMGSVGCVSGLHFPECLTKSSVSLPFRSLNPLLRVPPHTTL